jgi:hypothetical protein
VAVNRELDRSLMPWKATNPARFSGAMRALAAFNAWTRAACQLVEDSHWFNLRTGERYDGTLRSMPFMWCEISLLEERFFFARTMVDGDHTALASRVEELQARGKAVLKRLVAVREQAAALDPAGAPDAGADCYPCPITRAAKAELLHRLDEAQAAIDALAKLTCDAWPALAARLGGHACPAALAPYYAARLDLDDLW